MSEQQSTSLVWIGAVTALVALLVGIFAALYLSELRFENAEIFWPAAGAIICIGVLVTFAVPMFQLWGWQGVGILLGLITVPAAYAGDHIYDYYRPAALPLAGSAAADARLSLDVDVARLENGNLRWAQTARLEDGDRFRVSVRVINLGYEATIEDGVVLFKITPEAGGVMSLRAEIKAPGFLPDRSTARVMALAAGSAEVTKFDDVLVTYTAEDYDENGDDAGRTVPLDILNGPAATWHLPAILTDGNRDTAWIEFDLKFRSVPVDQSNPPG